MEKSEPSICIPRTTSSVTQERVHEVFSHVLGEGAVEQVDVVSSRDGKYKRVFVHLKAWPDSRDGNYFRDRLLAGDHVNIANGHDMLWRGVQSRLKRPTRQWMGGNVG